MAELFANWPKDIIETYRKEKYKHWGNIISQGYVDTEMDYEETMSRINDPPIDKDDILDVCVALREMEVKSENP